MIIPMEALSAEALTGLIEEFITREGTDYGEQVYTLADKVEQVRQQLARGDVVIIYSQVDETVSLVSRPTLNLAATDQQA